jgi:type VI secretion system secreted protein Hcp
MDYMLLEIQDKVKIDGESTLDKFEKFIELSSYSHGVSNFIQPTTSNTGRTSGRPNFQEMTVTKKLDLTTPVLNHSCAIGQNLGTTRLHLVRQDATADGKVSNAIDYMIYEMTETMISSVSVGGGGGSIPMETVSLNFSKLTWTYQSQKPDIGVEGNISHFWDQATNTGG